MVTFTFHYLPSVIAVGNFSPNRPGKSHPNREFPKKGQHPSYHLLLDYEIIAMGGLVEI